MVKRIFKNLFYNDTKINKLNNNIDLKKLYVVLSVSGIFLTLAALFLSHGGGISRIFYSDAMDTGMDFFHSIEYTKGRVPYEKFSTLYPPLANLFFYCIFRFVPAWQHDRWTDSYEEGILTRGTEIDLRVWQPTMLMFIVFIMVTVLLIIYMVLAYFKNDSSPLVKMMPFCVLFSFSMLYAFERGNIVVLSWVCVLFFLKYRNSENKVVRELALISLAIAAGLKMYPALFGVILIYDRQYKRAVRTVIYGVALFILPCLAFREGFSGLLIFFNKLMGHSSSGTSATGGYDLAGICNSAIEKLFNVRLGCNLPLAFGMVHNIIGSVTLLVFGFFSKKEWQRILNCSVAVLLFQNQGNYGMILLLLPLLALIKEERVLTIRNALPFLAIIFCTVMLPVFDPHFLQYSLKAFRLQVGMILLLIYCFAEMCIYASSVIKARRSKKTKA